MKHLDTLARTWLKQPGWVPLKRGLRGLQTLLNHVGFQRLRQVTARLPLAPLLARQPRFVYKYLPPYVAAHFDRPTRLAVLLNHYEFLERRVGATFFTALATGHLLWRERVGDDWFTITLSYPPLAGFEAELSLNFALNGTVLQVVAFVVAPGHVLGVSGAQAVLFSQVQGVKNVGLLKQATRALHNITPGILLVNAAYGLAAALGIEHAAGVGSEAQLSAGPQNYFDYSAFWLGLGGRKAACGQAFLLPMPTPEKPIAQIASHHRGRTLRKRGYKQRVREAVEHRVRTTFGLDLTEAVPVEASLLVLAGAEVLLTLASA